MAEQGFELSGEGPGGFKGALKGSSGQLLDLLIAVAAAAWVWFLVIYVQDAKSSERERARIVETAKLTEAIKEQTKVIERQEVAQKKMNEGVIFVLALPQAKRERLNLQEPEVVRDLRRYDR